MATAPLRLPDSPSRTPTAAQKAIRLARAHRAGEPVGHLVRALRKEMPALESLQTKLGGPDFEWSPSTSIPATPKNEEFPERRHLTGSAISATKKPRFFRILKVSDGHWECRLQCWSTAKLRDRHHCRTRGMGQRRCAQVDHGGHEALTIIPDDAKHRTRNLGISARDSGFTRRRCPE